MNYIKAIDSENKVQYINFDKVVSISEYPNGNIKILIGAGLYFEILPHTIESVDIFEVLERW